MQLLYQLSDSCKLLNWLRKRTGVPKLIHGARGHCPHVGTSQREVFSSNETNCVVECAEWRDEIARIGCCCASS